ncbi:MAG TPA: hypothetical protein VNN07_03930 [Candidatus Tectomicrobia bacterium]|nr:hypothetical protein [Candidatus Tectomicrobia bacterium]
MAIPALSIYPFRTPAKPPETRATIVAATSAPTTPFTGGAPAAPPGSLGRASIDTGFRLETGLRFGVGGSDVIMVAALLAALALAARYMP